MARTVRSALLRFPDDSEQGRSWLSFSHPTETITATTLDEVVPAMDRADAAAAAGSWVVGMVSYDAAPAFDPALASLRNEAVPLVAFGVFDRAEKSDGPSGGEYMVSKWTASRSRTSFGHDIDRVRSLIAAGETYQINYTMRLKAAFAGDPRGLFAALARAQHADHLAFLDLGDAAVCSASPELFLRRDGDMVTGRPMKGTRPRSTDPARDAELARELVASEKDRAENTMIVDMTRNDLGRIAQIGTVETPVLHHVESYPTVHTMTSTVTARTNASLSELFAATFPGASITGAPKVRTTHAIADLERTPRGIFYGCVGALSPAGTQEFNIAIRTVWVDTRRGSAEYGVGGGIVWDSTAESEWQEARDKTKVLVRASATFELLETMRWTPSGGVMLRDRHLTRVRRAADHFGFGFDVQGVETALDRVRGNVDQRLRLVCSADASFTLTEVSLDDEFVSTPDQAADLPVWQLPLDSAPIDLGDEFLFHKTTRRERYEAARASHPNAPDVLLWNERRELTETTIGNLVVRLDGRLVTPPVASSLLVGTFREELLAIGVISEQVVSIDDLLRADELYMINSVRGWVRIVAGAMPRLPGPMPRSREV
jgi:para-aminobenzoate synthetase / 4-amino-4-deoxychorismate lyase